jgi:MerR family transcriptional regulator, mercuric resistance operon regulatory protein
MDYTIGALARQGGVSVETIRFYQRRRLLRTPKRSAGLSATGGIRRYSEEDVQCLRFIRAAQVAGFTLRQIEELLSLDASHNRSRAWDLATQQIAVLDSKISELQHARRKLRQLAGVCGSGGRGPCPIIMTFRGQKAPGGASVPRRFQKLPCREM